MNTNEKKKISRMQKLKFYYHSKRHILFSRVHSGLSGPKKRKLGSILQMQLMEFHLLIEQKWEENVSTLSLTAKNELVHFGKIVFKHAGEGPPSITRSDITSHNKSKKKNHT